VKGAGAKFAVALQWLRRVRWQRFIGVRFLGATLAATVLVQLVSFPAYAPIGAAAGAGAEHASYVGFSAALREAYRDLARIEGATPGTEFDGAPLERDLKLLDARTWPEPRRPAARGLDGPSGIAVDEARMRLLRIYGLSAREAHPREAAAAQTALECWALRASLRRDAAAVAECRERFFAAVIALEDALLPLKTPDVFHRRLAREYLAYAHYKSAVEGDQIDARQFADKGLRAAEAQSPVEPEELERWFAFERRELRDLSLWRIRLALAIEKHRAGPQAATAALALARYDCWVDRAAERARAAHAAKCRGEFIDAMRALEGEPPAPGETLAVRFGYDRLALDPAERAKIAGAARTALERNAFVSVSALAQPRGHRDIETRQAWRRAETVAEALAEAGVPAERIRLLQRAALDKETESGIRRVDIVID
jgi:OOP family OmpA-OmpF porin